MKLIVIIPTLGRKDILNRTLAQLSLQSRLPDEVIITAPSDDDIGELHAPALNISRVFGSKGLTAQRNRALEHALPHADIITFFDDDFLPGAKYLEGVEAAFNEHPEWAVINGSVVADGARDAGLSFDEGLVALNAYEAGPPGKPSVTEHPGAYGCNMSVRARDVGSLRFDERLVLYGWQEDIDFTAQLRRHGKIVSLSAIHGVHLGVKSGRVSGVRFGYSQIVNPIYLIFKGTVPAPFALELLFRNLTANVVRSIRPEPWVDRRGRLRGNAIALLHLMTGRVEPEHVLKL